MTRHDWFKQAKFGMMVHWGLYALPAGAWKGKKVDYIGEWLQHEESIPVAEYERIGTEFSIPYFPHISVGWDCNPRLQNFQPGVVKDSTPEQIRKALELARDYADRHPAQAPLITINSWNEWTETSYLQPDDLYGYGYLEAVRDMFRRMGQETMPTKIAEQRMRGTQ